MGTQLCFDHRKALSLGNRVVLDDGVCYRRAARRLSIRSGLKTRLCKSTCVCFAMISRAKSIKGSEWNTPAAVEAEQNLRSCSRTKPGCQSGPALLQILPRTYVDALGAGGGTHLRLHTKTQPMQCFISSPK